jgi:arylsulfatase A-like enzyme
MAEPETHGFDLYAPFGDATLADSAIRYLNDHRDGPFFLVASFDNPHNICEWSRGQRLPWGSIDERPLEHCPNLPPNFAAPPFESEFLRNWISHAFVTFATQHYTPDQWRRYRNAYYRLVERVDAEIGKVLAAIDELGLADDTLVVFASDHGDGEGAHRWSNKQALYEECIRVPLILTGPGVQTGRVVDTPVAAALDLMPTLCDAAGASMPEGRLGRSLLPAAAGDDLPARDVVVETTIEGRVNGKAMIGERYKYVCYSHGRHREALHDLHADPGEMVNLALEARHAEQLQACRDALERWCDQTGSTWASQIPRVQDRRLAER